MSSTPQTLMERIRQLHEEACARDEDTYTDPATGYTVFTRRYHERRGTCCGSACRHCPYAHENVPSVARRRNPLPPLPGIILAVMLWMCATNLMAQYVRTSIDTVKYLHPGVGQNQGQGPVFFPKNIFGPPGGDGNDRAPAVDPRQLCSIGYGGEIVVGFRNHVVVDGPGPDFTVFENSFVYRDSLTFAEPAAIAVSADGVTYTTFPFDSLTLKGCAGVTPRLTGDAFDPSVSGGDAFDLADIGMDSIRWIRITDTTRMILNNRQHPRWDPTLTGFDLDAVTTPHAVARAFADAIALVANTSSVLVQCMAPATLRVVSVHGALMEEHVFAPGVHEWSFAHIPHGAWLLVVHGNGQTHTVKVLR